MTKNLSYGLTIIRDEKCFRAGNQVVSKDSNSFILPDVRPLIDAGLVLVDSLTGRVTITLVGLSRIHSDLNYRTRKKAEDFIAAHDSFYLMDGYLRAVDGGHISLYVADFFIRNGTLVQRPDGRYGKAVTLIEVGPGEVVAVREFLRCLRLTSVLT